MIKSLRTRSRGFFVGPNATEPNHVLAMAIQFGRPLMIVVMKPASTSAEVEHVVKLVREMGLKDHVIVGTERTVVAVIGDDRFKDRSRFETVEGVDRVVP